MTHTFAPTIEARRLAQLPDRKLVNLIRAPLALVAKWRSPTSGKLCAAMWVGKAVKPTWRYSFATEADRTARITRALAAVVARPVRKLVARALEVGDILRASWGYDQTNIDYYQVVALAGATQVEMRPIAGHSLATGDMTGRSVPTPGEFTGPAKRYRAQGDRIRVTSYCSAHRLQPTTVAGVTVYPSAAWSAYA